MEGHVAYTVDVRNAYRVQHKKLKGRVHLDNLAICAKIILK
jgi:hypothetical protein